MSLITIQSLDIPDWQGPTTGVKLRVYANGAFMTSEGFPIEGKPKTARLVPCTTASVTDANGLTYTKLTIPLFSLYCTTDSINNPGVTYSAEFVDARGNVITPFKDLQNFRVSPTLVIAPATTTQWKDIVNYNLINYVFPPDTYYTKDQINSLFASVSRAGTFSSIINVKEDYGAKGDGASDDTVAIANALSASRTSGKPVYFPTGTYLTDPITQLGYGQILFGAGPNQTFLKARLANNAVINATALGQHYWQLRDLCVRGQGVGSGVNGHGIVINASDYPSGFKISNVIVDLCGGDGIKLPAATAYNLEDVFVNQASGNAYVLYTGNSCSLTRCSVGTLPTAGAVGFWLLAGSFTLRGCNSMASGNNAISYRIGQSVASGDAGSTVARASIIGSNVEQFIVGIQVRKDSYFSVTDTRFDFIYANGKGIEFQDSTGGNQGYWSNNFYVIEGGSLLNGKFIHSNNGSPLLLFGVSDTAQHADTTFDGTTSYYATDTAASRNLPILKAQRQAGISDDYLNVSTGISSPVIVASSQLRYGSNIFGQPFEVNKGGVNTLAVVSNTTTTGYSGWRAYNDLQTRSLNVEYYNSAFASAALTGGPTGEQGAIYNSGNFPLIFGINNTTKAILDATNLKLLANLIFTDNTYDIGATGGVSRPRNVHVGTQISINATAPTYTLEVNTPDSATGGILVSTAGFTLVPNPGSISNKTVLNARGFNLCTDTTVLSAGYQPTLGVGISVGRADPAVGIKNTSGPALVIEQGNVGIGLSGPSRALHIQKSGNSAVIQLEATGVSGSPEMIFTKVAATDFGTFSWYTGVTRNYFLSHYSDNSLRITRNSTTDDFVLNNSGNVSIAVSSTIGASAPNGTTPLTISPTFNPSSGAAAFVGLGITPTWNTSGTWAGTLNALLVNVTETSTAGATAKNLLNLQVGGATKAVVTDTGSTIFGGASSITAVVAGFPAGASNPVLEINNGASNSAANGQPFLSLVNNNSSATGGSIGQVTFVNSNVGGSEKRLASIYCETDGATNSGYLAFFTTSAGTFSERLRITSGGLLSFGAAANTVPALKRSTTTLAFRLGDDSGPATYFSTRKVVTWAATTNFDLALGNIQYVVLGGATTITISNPQDGAKYVIFLVQDATGSRTVTWPATAKFPGGTAPVLTATANAKDMFEFVSDGTNIYQINKSLDVR